MKIWGFVFGFCVATALWLSLHECPKPGPQKPLMTIVFDSSAARIIAESNVDSLTFSVMVTEDSASLTVVKTDFPPQRKEREDDNSRSN